MSVPHHRPPSPHRKKAWLFCPLSPDYDHLYPPAPSYDWFAIIGIVRFTRYFETMRLRSDRAMIMLEWIERVVLNPEREIVQQDGRIRRWAAIREAEGRYLRVVLMPDGETVHNAFFDRSFVP